MSITPLARWKNYYVSNLIPVLKIFSHIPPETHPTEALQFLEKNKVPYKKTAYQFFAQLGIHNKSDTIFFNIHRYLLKLDEDGVQKYLQFWAHVYYTPNPFVKVTNDRTMPPLTLFEAIVSELLSQPPNQEPFVEIDFEVFFDNYFGGKNEDILFNVITQHLQPLKTIEKNKKKYIQLHLSHIPIMNQKLVTLKKVFPIPIKHDDRFVFFQRFSEENYITFNLIQENL